MTSADMALLSCCSSFPLNVEYFLNVIIIVSNGIHPWFLLGGAGPGAAEEVVVDLGQLELLLGVGHERLLHVAHHLPRDQQGGQQLSFEKSYKQHICYLKASHAHVFELVHVLQVEGDVE